MIPVSIIVPYYKDNDFLKAKLNNLMALKYYPTMIEILFVHGGASCNQTVILNDSKPLVKVIHMKASGKTNQINKGLEEAHCDHVMITDIDAMIDDTALFDIMKQFDDPSVGVVGLWTVPQGGYFFDCIYWLIANWIRVIETWYETCSHPVAPCYMFKRGSGANPKGYLPSDVIADDVYVAFRSNFDGYKTKYIRSSKAYELRHPRNAAGFIAHKTRKGNALLREILRFMYRLPDASMRWKIIYALRFFQFTVLTPTIAASYPFYKQNSTLEKVS